MKIKSLKISNFKCFKEFTFCPINNNLNLLVGENGVGKSTIFESIRILLDKDFGLKDNFLDEDFNDKIKPIILELDLEFSMDYTRLKEISEFISDIDGEIVKIRIGFIIRKKEIIDNALDKKERDKLKSYNEGFFYSRIGYSEVPTGNIKIDFLYENYKVGTYDFKELFNIIYIDGSRSYNQFYENGGKFSKLIANEKENLEGIQVFEADYKNKLLAVDGLDTFFKGTTGNINDEIKKINLEKDNEKSSKLEVDTVDNTLPFRILKNILKINFNDIPLDKNSIGWQYIYYTIFNLFYIEKNIETDEGVNNILLMEEPEAHLHPQMQRKLFHYIDNHSKSNNLFVSTHSQTIIRTIRDIKKTNLIGVNSVSNFPSIGDLSSLNITKLNTFIDINKAELFFSRGIIFVEGISEEILLPKLFERKFCGKKLDDYGVSIININGIDFIEYCKLAKAYNIPFVIITDRDILKNSTGIIIQDYLRRITGIDIDKLFIADIDTLEIDLLKGNIVNNKFMFEELFEIEGKFLAKKLAQAKTNLDEIISDITYSDNYITLKNSFFGNYISNKNGLSKSEFSYGLENRLENNYLFNIPDYINKAFDKIVDISLKN